MHTHRNVGQRPKGTTIMVAFGVFYGTAAFVVFASAACSVTWGRIRSATSRCSWSRCRRPAPSPTSPCWCTASSDGDRTPRASDPLELEWHFLIPARDEESVIAATVSAARTTFPNVHVWVIDDASEDATAEIAQHARDFDHRVHLIRQVRPDARIGKGEALNHAYGVVSEFIGDDPGDRARAVIGILDADGYLSDGALEHLSGPETFGDPGVGAAQLEVWMKNRNEWLRAPSTQPETLQAASGWPRRGSVPRGSRRPAPGCSTSSSPRTSKPPWETCRRCRQSATRRWWSCTGCPCGLRTDGGSADSCTGARLGFGPPDPGRCFDE